MIYQIDHSSAASGKRVSMTKRRVTWRWGIANEKAMKKGNVGVECRGHEHEISLIWSIASGKKVILEDGNQVHYSLSRRPETKFHQSWNGKYHNSVFTIVAHASQPINANARPGGFKQFELFIDGCSFDALPKIYELSSALLRGRNARHRMRIPSSRVVYQPSSSSNSYSNREESTTELHWAQKVDNLEHNREMNNHTPTELYSSVPKAQDILSMVPTESLMDMEYPTTPSLASTTCWESDNIGSCDSFGYSPTTIAANKPPSYEAIQNAIMDKYNTHDFDTIHNHNHEQKETLATETYLPDISKLCIDTSSQPENMLDKNPLSFMESPKDVSDFDSVVKDLVNLDDISSSVFKGYTKETHAMNQTQNVKSLAELKSSSSSSSSSSGPAKEIMKNHHLCAVNNNPAALVVYGQQQQQQQPQQSYNNYNMYNASPMYGSSYGAY